jgi:heme oxygenase (mycobilin-producing)
MSHMSVVKIFAIAVEDGAGEAVENLIAARAHAYVHHEGFERLELLEPTDGRTEWFLVTRWADIASFDEFVAGPAFADHAAADRIASFGGPESLTSEVWSFRVAVESST